jgi:hypothetical protein
MSSDWCLHCNHPDFCHHPDCDCDITGDDVNTPCDCKEFKPQ